MEKLKSVEPKLNNDNYKIPEGIKGEILREMEAIPDETE